MLRKIGIEDKTGFKRMLTLIVCCLVIIMFKGLGKWLTAKEWSEEIRMTDSNGYYLRGNNFTAEVDSRDNIHAIYDYSRYEDERLDDDQAVYQKFNRYGESLTEPLVLGHVAEWFDAPMWCYDLFLDNNDNIHILWGNWDTKRYTMLSNDGEVLIANALLGGRVSSGTVPQIAIDSEGNIILLFYFRPEPVEETDQSIAYARFSPEGEIIDSVHVIWSHPTTNARDLNLEIDENDVIYIAWEHQSDRTGFTVHYTVVAPDNELIIDDFSLPSLNDHQGITYEALAIDSEHRPLFVITSNSQYNIVRYNSDLERELTTYLGHWRGVGVLRSDIVIDGNGNIHVINNLKDDDLNDGTYFLGYAELNSEGEISDSLQVINDPRNHEGGPNPAAWTGIKLLSFSDDVIGVVWADGRHADYDRGIEKELYMRYSILDNPVKNIETNIPNSTMAIMPIYPNPFNNSTLIRYKLPYMVLAELQIFDINGRIVYNRGIKGSNNNTQVFIWEGVDNSGFYLPSGSYWIRLKRDNLQAIEKVVLVR